MNNNENGFEEVSFLINKKKNIGRQANIDPNTVAIHKGTIAVRRGVLDSLGVTKGNYASIGIDKQKRLCLITGLKPNEHLRMLTSAGVKNAKTMYVQIPKESRELLSGFRGTYYLGQSAIFGNYTRTILIKQ